jgi:hypothetical protein
MRVLLADNALLQAALADVRSSLAHERPSSAGRLPPHILCHEYSLWVFVQPLVWYMCCTWQLLKLSVCQLQRAWSLQGEVRFALPLRNCSASALSALLH